jgi:hypothetical protein
VGESEAAFAGKERTIAAPTNRAICVIFDVIMASSHLWTVNIHFPDR